MKKTIFLKFLGSIGVMTLIVITIILTKVDSPFAIFFLLPIVYFAFQKEVRLWHIISITLCATIFWIFTFCRTQPSPFNQIVLVNALLRFGIYFTISLLIMMLVRQRTELAQKNEELLTLNQEKNIMLGIAAHDIRNAAGAVAAFSEILLAHLKKLPELKNEIRIATILYSSSESLMQLVTSILDISKIESGQIHLKKILGDYNTFIESRVNLLQIIAQQKNIKLVFDKFTSVIQVSFDPIYLIEVIDNLISNAIKYSNRDSEVHIKIQATENQVKTEIVDHGIGINPTEIDGLFTPFYKTSSRPTEGESSSGLGLAIAQKVVKLHGGEIGVTSQKGLGSTFYFTLPL